MVSKSDASAVLYIEERSSPFIHPLGLQVRIVPEEYFDTSTEEG